MMYQTDARTTKAPPACPVCDGLVCVCRPRFFSGQLLTDVELTAQQEWAIAKNRLHNLHLHGPGVVCGLKVSCHPNCAGWVRISEGYAISPCGDDIVVCETDDFDLVGAIEACLREQARKAEPDCSPRRGGTVDCTTDGEWCITICYEEWADRPVRPLRTGHEGSCSPGCSCSGASKTGSTYGGSTYGSSTYGGSAYTGSGGCSCGGSKTTTTGRGCIPCGTGKSRCEQCGGAASCTCSPAPITTRTGPPECEPTRWCEGYRIQVCRKEEGDDDGNLFDLIEGTLLGEVIECWLAIAEMQALVASYKTPRDSCYALDALKAKMLAFVEHIGITRCELIDAIHAIHCTPPPSDIASIDITAAPTVSGAALHGQATEYVSGVEVSAQSLRSLSLQILIFCLCEHLLPPCPPPATDNCLCLACVTVRDGRIIDICNFGCRPQVITWPAVRWWASILPIEPLIRILVERLCCGDLFDDRVGVVANPAVAQLMKQWMATETPKSAFSSAWGGHA